MRAGVTPPSAGCLRLSACAVLCAPRRRSSHFATVHVQPTKGGSVVSRGVMVTKRPHWWRQGMGRLLGVHTLHTGQRRRPIADHAPHRCSSVLPPTLVDPAFLYAMLDALHPLSYSLHYRAPRLPLFGDPVPRHGVTAPWAASCYEAQTLRGAHVTDDAAAARWDSGARRCAQARGLARDEPATQLRRPRCRRTAVLLGVASFILMLEC